jgi:hypothetical protein
MKRDKEDIDECRKELKFVNNFMNSMGKYVEGT